MGSETVSNTDISNPSPNSVSTSNSGKLEGDVSVLAEKSVAFSPFGHPRCSFWLKRDVRDVGEATGDVCNEEMVIFCEVLLVMACVVLIFVFLAFFPFIGSSGCCDVATRVGEPIP